ncbi:MAG TPA: type I glyceraldehyde-3-phosphate dehydrogenase [Thermomicrobiales bacterium]|nr:type I glyceraldehyde-3-phosphate dehydrogenase [Thermomicrobiales bacterium]
MVYKIGINGFGRIGRQVFKAVQQGGFGDLFEIVAVNDLTSNDTLAHLLKYDSTYGILDADVSSNEEGITVDGKLLKVFEEKDPAQLPWGELGVDLVVESTGRFTKAAAAKAHLDAGAKKVVISAPLSGTAESSEGAADAITIVLGVNESAYDPAQHNIVSNASCTTNCLAPAAKVISDTFGIEYGMMTTVHSYTADQVLQDGPHKDLRRARGAAQNIIPTSTGAARALSLVLPELEGKFDGFALRVPTPTVSIVDFVATTTKPVTVESVNDAFRKASQSDEMAGIIGYSEDPLVSMDYKGDSRSSIIDSLSTMVQGENMVKVVSWYDNEWGYSCRVADLVALICEKGFEG